DFNGCAVVLLCLLQLTGSLVAPAQEIKGTVMLGFDLGDSLKLGQSLLKKLLFIEVSAQVLMGVDIVGIAFQDRLQIGPITFLILEHVATERADSVRFDLGWIETDRSGSQFLAFYKLSSPEGHCGGHLKGSRVAWCNLLKHLNLFFRLLPLVESHQHVDQGQSCQNIGAFVLQQISEERAGLVESAEVQGTLGGVPQLANTHLFRLRELMSPELETPHAGRMQPHEKQGHLRRVCLTR